MHRRRQEVEETLENFFDHTTSVELNWLSEEPDHAKLTKEYKNLTYSEKDGYGVKKLDPETVCYTGHTKGVTVRKSFEEMEEGWEDVSRSIYIPEPHANIPVQKAEEFFNEINPLADGMTRKPFTTYLFRTSLTRNESVQLFRHEFFEPLTEDQLVQYEKEYDKQGFGELKPMLRSANNGFKDKHPKQILNDIGWGD